VGEGNHNQNGRTKNIRHNEVVREPRLLVGQNEIQNLP